MGGNMGELQRVLANLGITDGFDRGAQRQTGQQAIGCQPHVAGCQGDSA